MCDNPYKPPKMRPGRRHKIKPSRPLNASMILWLIVGMLGAIPTIAVWFDGSSWDGFHCWTNDGVTLRCRPLAKLGPVIPAMFLGATAFALMTDPIARSHTEAVWKDPGVPVAGALLGAVIGFLADRVGLTGQRMSKNFNQPEPDRTIHRRNGSTQ